MRYRFADCVLDTDKRELTRGDKPVQVGPLPFDLLTFLIRNRDRVVTKEDLLKDIWSGRTVSDSTLISHLKAARVAIGDSGEEQSLIRTLNRKGFRFIGDVEAIADPDAPADQPPAVSADEAAASRVREQPVALPTAPPAAPAASRSRKPLVIGTALAVVLAAGAALALRAWPEPPLDATQVPLVTDKVRGELASYNARPQHKAIAITPGRAFVADSEVSREAATKTALTLCERDNKRRRRTAPCLSYAEGSKVVLPPAFPIAPVELRTASVAPLDVDRLPLLSERARSILRDREVREGAERIIFISSAGQWYRAIRGTQAEAFRIGVDYCRHVWRQPCFILAVNDNLIAELPSARKVVGIFLPPTDAAINTADRASIVEAYASPAWRAAAQGAKGWHAVGGAADEAAAIEAVMQKCAGRDENCRLFAIGNFRVGTEAAER